MRVLRITILGAHEFHSFRGLSAGIDWRWGRNRRPGQVSASERQSVQKFVGKVEM